MTFFDKMSCHRARVKIKIGMVTFSHPCVYMFLHIIQGLRYSNVLFETPSVTKLLDMLTCRSTYPIDFLQKLFQRAYFNTGQWTSKISKIFK